MKDDLLIQKNKLIECFKNEKQKLLVDNAFDFAYRCHKDQVRDSGSEYIYHPLRVAESLASKGFNYKVIISALLHDVVEDANIDLQEITNNYGYDVSEIISLLTKPKLSPFFEWVFADHPNFVNISNDDYKTEKNKYYNERVNIYYNRLFNSCNINALYVKLYDNLDNISDFASVPIEKRTRQLNNILEHSVWIARRLLNKTEFNKFLKNFKDNGFEISDKDYKVESLKNPILVMPTRDKLGFEVYQKMPLSGTKYISIYGTIQSLIFRNYLEVGLPAGKREHYFELLKMYFPEHIVARAKSLVPKSAGIHEKIYRFYNFRKEYGFFKIKNNSLFLKTESGVFEIKNYTQSKIYLKGENRKIYLEAKVNYNKFIKKLEKFFYKYVSNISNT